MEIERRLNNLKSDVLELHNIAKKSVSLCLDGLRGNDDVRRELESLEKEADVLHSDIDYNCVTFIALFQPVARDLRFVISMMKISSAYERITDLALEIAYYYCYDENLLNIFDEMRNHLLEMFKVVEKSYDEKVDLINTLKQFDDKIDVCYEKAVNYLKERCKVEMVLVSRHLERIGDLLCKIGARIIFVDEGRRVWIK